MTTFINNSVHNVSIYSHVGRMSFQGINNFVNHKGGIISSNGGQVLFEGWTKFANIKVIFDLPIVSTLQSNVQICGDTYFQSNHVMNQMGMILFTSSTLSLHKWDNYFS